MAEVETNRESAVLTVTLNRPEVFNAFNAALHAAFAAALKEARDAEVRAVVITGAGLSLAAACDLRIAADTATFVPGFIGIGLVPDSGGSYFIHRLLGNARAVDWMTTNKRLGAAEALEWGLVNEVVEADSLLSHVAEVAATYATLPTKAIGMTKRLFDHADTATLEEQLAMEAQLQQAATQTGDFREGVNAFLEKRPPNFSGA